MCALFLNPKNVSCSKPGQALDQFSPIRPCTSPSCHTAAESRSFAAAVSTSYGKKPPLRGRHSKESSRWALLPISAFERPTDWITLEGWLAETDKACHHQSTSGCCTGAAMCTAMQEPCRIGSHAAHCQALSQLLLPTLLKAEKSPTFLLESWRNLSQLSGPLAAA